MRISFLRKQALKLGLNVDSRIVFMDDTHAEVVAKRQDGIIFCLSPIYLNKFYKHIPNKYKNDIERYAYLASYPNPKGRDKIVTTTKQALDCLRAFARNNK